MNPIVNNVANVITYAFSKAFISFIVFSPFLVGGYGE
jgi:hypothetical protein